MLLGIFAVERSRAGIKMIGIVEGVIVVGKTVGAFREKRLADACGKAALCGGLIAKLLLADERVVVPDAQSGGKAIAERFPIFSVRRLVQNVWIAGLAEVIVAEQVVAQRQAVGGVVDQGIAGIESEACESGIAHGS